MQTVFWREAASGRTEEMDDMILMDRQEVGSAKDEVDGIGLGLCPGEFNRLRAVSNKDFCINGVD
jgi:hypothetical protein